MLARFCVFLLVLILLADGLTLSSSDSAPLTHLGGVLKRFDLITSETFAGMLVSMWSMPQCVCVRFVNLDHKTASRDDAIRRVFAYANSHPNGLDIRRDWAPTADCSLTYMTNAAARAIVVLAWTLEPTNGAWLEGINTAVRQKAEEKIDSNTKIDSTTKIKNAMKRGTLDWKCQCCTSFPPEKSLVWRTQPRLTTSRSAH